MYDLSGLIHYDVIVTYQPVWGRMATEMPYINPLSFKKAVLDLSQTMPTAARFITVAAAYVQQGQQVFAVGPRLQSFLHETACENVPQELLKLPYSCIYVALPECPWRLWGGPTGMHNVAGLYLYEHNGGLSVLLWGKANEKSTAPDDDASFWVHLPWDEVPSRQEDTSCLNIESYLEYLFKLPDRERSDAGMHSSMMPPEAQEEQDKSIRSLLRFAINFVLYLNSTNIETKKGHAVLPRLGGKRKKQGPTKPSQAKVLWVGPTIEKSEQAARKQASGGGGGGTWVYRRGHFHHFWVGPKTDAQGNPQLGTHRVQKWIPPKRRDLASVVESKTRVHRVREARAKEKGSSE